MDDRGLRRRKRPSIWVTTPAKIMAGDQQCEYAPFLKAKYLVPRQPGDFDLASWTAQHNVMVQARAKELRADGWEVYLEGQNAFKLVGKSGAELAGRPDIVAVRGEEARVIDCKTGQPRVSDHIQVLLYMFALKRSHPVCKGKVIEGEVMYKDGSIEIPSEAVDDVFLGQLGVTMQKILVDEAPSASPSYHECRFCDIGKDLCPYRVDTAPGEVDVDLF